MRVLLVSHDFLPNHPAGTEVYTAEIGSKLRERGHEVELFTTEKDIGRPHLRLDRREWEGMVVHELVNNLFYDGFEETWDWPPAVEAFGRVLDAFAPDVVHVMHLLYLSVGCVEEAHRRGIPVFFTLNDYWLQCARFGQRIHADGSICHTIDFDRCGTCLASLKFAQSGLERTLARTIAWVHGLSGLDLAPLARRGAASLASGAEGDWTAPAPEPAQALAQAMARRDGELRRRLLPCVERFFAPSRFLRERFVEWGVPPEQIEHLPYGLDLAPFRGFEREPSDRVRVAFVGTLAPHKAPHLLLDAWRELPADTRAKGSLTLFGPKEHYPDYVSRLERDAREVGAAMPGRLDRADIPDAFRRIDLLVVPSVWYENSPFVIHEALATRTPLVVSDLGGMAELVEPDRQGWRFGTGDAADLARRLATVLADPSVLAHLDPGEDPVKDVAASAADLEQRYREALAST